MNRSIQTGEGGADLIRRPYRIPFSEFQDGVSLGTSDIFLSPEEAMKFRDEVMRELFG